MTERKKNIILADDDPDDRELFTEMIAEIGFGASAVKNGVELLARLNDGTAPLPDFIFLDLNMPILGGKECLAQIRSDNQFDTIPIIIYSTSSNQKDVKETFGLGANLYVVKASSYVVLKKTLQTILLLDWTELKRPKSIKDFVFNTV